jgi:glycosyltransferase involved in cell wall biosynthesis
MACGTPVIATDIPGNRELVPDASIGWRVPPGDAAALAQTIIAVLSDERKRSACAQNALEHVKNFQIEAVTAQYDLLYQELTGKKG